MDKIKNMEKTRGRSKNLIMDKINNMTCSKQMLTTAPYFACDYNKRLYIYIYH